MRNVPPIFGEGRTFAIACVTASAIGQALAAGFLAFETRNIFAALHGGEAALPALSLVILLAAGLTVAALRVWGRVVAEKLGQDYGISLRKTLFNHLAHLPASVVANRRKGALALRFVGDLATARNWVGLGVARTISAVVVLPGAAIVLVLLNPTLAAAAAAPIGLAVLLMLLVAPRIDPLHRRLRKERANLAIDVMERLSVAPELRLMGRAKRELQSLNQNGRNLRDASVRRVWGAAGLRGIPELGVAAAAALLLWAAFTTGAGPAEAAAALAVLGILVQPLRDLAGVWDRWCAWRIARAKCQSILATPRLARRRRPDRNRQSERDNGPVRLTFRAAAKGGLKQLDSTAEPGSKIAIIGPNGAGKSTCLALAAGLDQVEKGAVELDGVDIKELTAAERQRAIVYVGPQSPILRGSLRRALSLGCQPRPGDAVIEKASRDFGLGEVLERLGGLDAKVEAGGSNLSEGEARRLHLVRAALAKPRLLLMDDTDAVLDGSGRRAIERLVRETEATVLFVTRDPETARRAQCLWYLDGGTLAEFGQPDELLGGEGPASRYFRPRAVA